MDTSTMSRTWQRRVGSARRHGHRAVTSAVTLCAVLGAAAAIKVFLVTSHPTEGDVTAITNRIDNQRAPGSIDQECRGLHLLEPGTIDQPGRLRRERAMKTDRVGSCEHWFQRRNTGLLQLPVELVEQQPVGRQKSDH